MDKKERLTRIQRLQFQIRQIEWRAGRHIFAYPHLLRDKNDSLLNHYEARVKELQAELEEHQREHRLTLTPRLRPGRPKKVVKE